MGNLQQSKIWSYTVVITCVHILLHSISIRKWMNEGEGKYGVVRVNMGCGTLRGRSKASLLPGQAFSEGASHFQGTNVDTA